MPAYSVEQIYTLGMKSIKHNASTVGKLFSLPCQFHNQFHYKIHIIIVILSCIQLHKHLELHFQKTDQSVKYCFANGSCGLKIYAVKELERLVMLIKSYMKPVSVAIVVNYFPRRFIVS